MGSGGWGEGVCVGPEAAEQQNDTRTVQVVLGLPCSDRELTDCRGNLSSRPFHRGEIGVREVLGLTPDHPGGEEGARTGDQTL